MTNTTTPVRKQGISTTDLALIATFAALIAVCAILPSLSVTGVGVPFTLQMFGIFLAGSALGARRGFLAVLLYLAVGTAGVPIFAAGQAGPSVWVGATGGYLVAFPIAAFIVGLVATRVARTNPAAFTVVVSTAAAIVTVAVVGTLGTLGMAIKLDVGLGVAWGYATPFFIADIIKGVLAAVVAAAVLRAFPQLVAKRRA
ncbi:BioY family transporter [Aeromicrobium sp. A1-2]|uniref:biotin transporter BioY n=1 Tax=Aeromicrobium sp. A1-2 TaxID=2107713 RepID=UPI000E54E762|nr:biotin transporter BioY [Aeromicrobium sp. A1-2]AXT86229.1 BioY family transporter [Aeromicrobium sp. A1-2]